MKHIWLGGVMQETQLVRRCNAGFFVKSVSENMRDFIKNEDLVQGLG